MACELKKVSEISAPTENSASSLTPSNHQVLQPPSTAKILLKLFFHSIAMFTLPFVAYFLSKDFVEKEFGVGQPKNYIYGAISAVIVVQAVIFSYVYQAFKEEQLQKKVKAASKKE